MKVGSKSKQEIEALEREKGESVDRMKEAIGAYVRSAYMRRYG